MFNPMNFLPFNRYVVIFVHILRFPFISGVSVGHYIAYTRHPVTNEWHCYNDENVSKQKPPEEEYCNAYILFYKKKGE